MGALANNASHNVQIVEWRSEILSFWKVKMQLLILIDKNRGESIKRNPLAPRATRRQRCDDFDYRPKSSIWISQITISFMVVASQKITRKFEDEKYNCHPDLLLIRLLKNTVKWWADWHLIYYHSSAKLTLPSTQVFRGKRINSLKNVDEFQRPFKSMMKFLRLLWNMAKKKTV